MGVVVLVVVVVVGVVVVVMVVVVVVVVVYELFSSRDLTEGVHLGIAKSPQERQKERKRGTISPLYLQC